MPTLLSSLETQVRLHLLESASLTTPAAPVITNGGTPGVVSYSYTIVAIDANGTTDASTAGSTTTGNATLTGVNFNTVTWTAVPQAVGYWVYRTASGGTPSTTGRIAVVGAVVTINDTGLAIDGSPVIAPIVNTSGLSNPFWTSAELLFHINRGIRDLWKAIVDLHQGHFVTIDATNVTLPANSDNLAGVPTNCFRILMIEPRVLTSLGTTRMLYFKPKQYQGAAFQAARSQTVVDPTTTNTIFYDILNAGSPVNAPTITIAPQISSAVNLRLVYVNTLATAIATDNNPIPGEADNALIAWTVAWALAKEGEQGQRSPDPSWIAIYSSEKQQLLTVLTPRQEQEEEVVEGLFDGMFEDW